MWNLCGWRVSCQEMSYENAHEHQILGEYVCLNWFISWVLCYGEFVWSKIYLRYTLQIFHSKIFYLLFIWMRYFTNNTIKICAFDTLTLQLFLKFYLIIRIIILNLSQAIYLLKSTIILKKLIFYSYQINTYIVLQVVIGMFSLLYLF